METGYLCLGTIDSNLENILYTTHHEDTLPVSYSGVNYTKLEYFDRAIDMTQVSALTVTND